MSCDLRRSRLGTFLGLGTKRVALVTPLCLQFSTDEATTGSPTPGLVSHPSLCEHTHSLTHSLTADNARAALPAAHSASSSSASPQPPVCARLTRRECRWVACVCVCKSVAHVQAGNRTALRSTLVLCDAAVLLLCLRRSVLFVRVCVCPSICLSRAIETCSVLPCLRAGVHSLTLSLCLCVSLFVFSVHIAVVGAVHLVARNVCSQRGAETRRVLFCPLVLCDAAVLLLCLRRSVLFVYVYVLVHQSVCLEL